MPFPVVDSVEESLKKQLAVYQPLIDAAPDIIHIISPDMRIVLRNRRSRQWFPRVRTGEHCYRGLHGLEHRCPHCSVRRVFEDGMRHEHESFIGERQHGKKIILHSTASPIYGEDGKILAALEILRDITSRKQMEQELRETAQRLERANRIRELLLRMVRHDLGTPVGVILNTAEYLLEEPERLGEFREDIEDIHKCSNHILQLIKDADVLSKVMTASRLVFHDIDISELLVSLMQKLEPVLKQSGVRLEKYLPERMIIKGMPILKTAFENIMVNGIKYGGSGGRLVVSAVENGSNVHVEIKDFGPGIPDRYKERIFEQFERLATDIPGTGLGLAIASQAVALHGGTIQVSDNPEGGAVFEVILPRDPEVVREGCIDGNLKDCMERDTGQAFAA